MGKLGVQISLNQAACIYDDGDGRIEAFHDMDLSVAPGESVALIGPSGCGKSSLLRMLAGLLPPTSGLVEVAGEAIVKPRRTTSYIPQGLGLLPWKTALQNVRLGLDVAGLPQAKANSRARAVLEEVGLQGFERSYPKSLSGGMRQRLALARALAVDADLLLMDEPLSAVDALLRESLQDVLLHLWLERGHTQVLVTHSIEEAVYLGARILVFSERPATLKVDLANFGMGTPAWRDSAEFSAMCGLVRSALAQDMAGEGSGVDAK